MKLTLVSDDGAVGIDGEFFESIDLTQLDPAIHAVQWYGEYGEVEYKTVFADGVISKPANQIITDVTPYQFAIDAWNAVKDAATQDASGIPVTEV